MGEQPSEKHTCYDDDDDEHDDGYEDDGDDDEDDRAGLRSHWSCLFNLHV